MAASIGFLKFPVTAGILSTWNSGINEDLFDTGDNTLKLFLHPEDYQPLEEDLGARGVVRGASSYLVQAPTRKIGFELSVLDSREAIPKTLETLRSANSGLVTVHDYIRVDAGDEATGYTTRSLIMEPPLRLSGALWYSSSATSDRLFTGGFTVRFIQP